MRTTLTIDASALDEAPALAITGQICETLSSLAGEPIAACGFIPINNNGMLVTNDLVRALRNDTGD